MSREEIFTAVQDFFCNQPAAKEALLCLKKGREIEIIVNEDLICALFNRDGQVVVEQRPAKDPDVRFFVNSTSVYALTAENHEDVGDLGISLLKQMVSNQIQLKLTGSFLSLIRGGYIEMIKLGGGKFFRHLSEHGLTNITKVIDKIRQLKKASK